MHISESGVIDYEKRGQRLDRVLAEMFPEYSRERLKAWLKSGELLIDGATLKPSLKVQGGEKVALTSVMAEVDPHHAEQMDLEIIDEDEHVIVVNKPAGLVVHPAPGNLGGTLLNGLLYHCPELVDLPRAGIVHRLDKETSGLMVVTKTFAAHKSLVDQLQARSVHRAYQCLVWGTPVSGETIEARMGRHPTDRMKMAVVDETEDRGKTAITHYRINHRFKHATFVDVQLETGRTHQIRVHMAHRAYPLVGDPVYGRKGVIPARFPEPLRDALKSFKRQALHARRLEFTHPEKGEVSYEAQKPDDFLNLLTVFKEHDSPDS